MKNPRLAHKARMVQDYLARTKPTNEADQLHHELALKDVRVLFNHLAKQERALGVVSNILSGQRFKRIVERLTAVQETVKDDDTAQEIILIIGSIRHMREMWMEMITTDVLDGLVKEMQGLMDDHLSK